MSTADPTLPAWQRWAPDVSGGVATFALGVVEVRGNVYADDRAAAYVIVLAVALGVGLSRALPAAALGAAWFAGTVQVTSGAGAMLVEVLLAVVAFGCARWGSAATVWLSGLSMPLGVLIAVLWLDSDLVYRALELPGGVVSWFRRATAAGRVVPPPRRGPAPSNRCSGPLGTFRTRVSGRSRRSRRRSRVGRRCPVSRRDSVLLEMPGRLGPAQRAMHPVDLLNRAPGPGRRSLRQALTDELGAHLRQPIHRKNAGPARRDGGNRP